MNNKPKIGQRYKLICGNNFILEIINDTGTNDHKLLLNNLNSYEPGMIDHWSIYYDGKLIPSWSLIPGQEKPEEN